MPRPRSNRSDVCNVAHLAAQALVHMRERRRHIAKGAGDDTPVELGADRVHDRTTRPKAPGLRVRRGEATCRASECSPALDLSVRPAVNPRRRRGDLHRSAGAAGLRRCGVTDFHTRCIDCMRPDERFRPNVRPNAPGLRVRRGEASCRASECSPALDLSVRLAVNPRRRRGDLHRSAGAAGAAPLRRD